MNCAISGDVFQMQNLADQVKRNSMLGVGSHLIVRPGQRASVGSAVMQLSGNIRNRIHRFRRNSSPGRAVNYKRFTTKLQINRYEILVQFPKRWLINLDHRFVYGS